MIVATNVFQSCIHTYHVRMVFVRIHSFNNKQQDNMQFMITRNNRKSSWDKFEVQDLAIEKFRQFATKHHVSSSF